VDTIDAASSSARRSLTTAELDELDQQLRRSRPRLAGVVGLGIFSAMFVVAAIISYLESGLARLEGPDILFSLGLVGGTIWQSARYFRTRQVYNSLVTDHAAGWVLAVKPKSGSPERQEVLPTSGVIWTSNGYPSEWRLLKTGIRKK
jgi:uncharacterized membrane protein